MRHVILVIQTKMVAAKLLTFLSFLSLVLQSSSESCTQQQQGTVRLIWGAGPWEGNVQICINGVWGWICQNSFYNNEAKVVCRQLGFNATGAVYRRYAYYGWPDPSAPIWLDQLGCNGNEANILACHRPKDFGDASCNHNALAAVLCQNGGTCTNGAIRMLRNSVSTPFRSNGRIEVCHNNQWGTICGTNWGTPDAKVACGQLGFSSSVATSYSSAQFGQGYGPVWMSNLGCTSSNSNLFSCSQDAIGTNNCPHTKDAGAGCRGEITTSCTSGSVKLYRPYHNVGPPNDGLALYCNNSRWVAVCDDGWSCYNAKMFCKKLGYPGALNTRSEYYYGYYRYTDNFRWSCNSKSVSLSSCSYTYRSSCSSLNDQLGIICYAPTQGNACNNGQVRLVNGNTTNEGKVEFCYEGDWSPLCSLSGIAATLVCKQLGYNSTLATVIDDQRFNRTDKRSSLNYITCPANATALSQCTTTLKGSSCFVSISKCSTEIGLRCHNAASSTCSDGQVRLVNGTLAQEGRVEVCVSGMWGSVCQSGFGQDDAYVICKALGYDGPSPSISYHAKYGEGAGPVVYSNVNCRGWETQLTECAKKTFPNIVCSPQNTVGVICKSNCNDGDIRLVGGDFPNEGTVEVCTNHLWGMVSNNTWTMNNTYVVCRQLGYAGGVPKYFSGSKFGKPAVMIQLKNVRCVGNEMRLADCSSKQLSLYAGRKQLATTNVAGVDCVYDVPTEPPCVPLPSDYTTPDTTCSTDGSIRLQGGDQASGYGRLEYCYHGYWSPFCKLDPVAASIACTELGFTDYTWATIVESGEFGALRNYSLFDNVTCSGSETHLSQCTFVNNTGCTPWCRLGNLGLRCYKPNVCTSGDIRLVDGYIENEGRVEVCINNVWGAICDNGWDKTDANVVCKQLGLSDTMPIVLSGSEFGSGQYPIVYSNMGCGGWETNITDCNKMIYPQSNCSRGNVAGVLCGYDCNDGDVRLVGSQWSYEGTVEVCFNNLWGLIADSNWNIQNAQIVCEQLGFQAQGSVGRTGSYYGKPNKTIHMANVQCDGTEQMIADCSYTSYSLSQGKQMLATTGVAGVTCYTPAQCVPPPAGGAACTNGDIRLTGGSSNDGMVQYCYNGLWSPFCNLGPLEATVACRQLGFTNYDITAVFTDGRFGRSSNVSLFQNFNCSLNQAATRLSGCSIVDSCQSKCKYPLGLRCYDSANCNDGQVRLINGSSSAQGRLEVCYSNIWGGVCGNNFDSTSAYVVCRELGLGLSEPTVYTNSYYGDGDGAIVYYNTTCKGYESSIIECSKQTYSTFTCSRSNVVGIACQEGCTTGSLRLVNGGSSSEGTLEVCFYNTWGLVADGGWSNLEAQVACKQLNFQGGRAVTGSQYGKPNAPLLISNTDCTGNEQRLRDCQYTLLSEQDSTTLYSTAAVAGISCDSQSPTNISITSPTTIGLIIVVLLMLLFLFTTIGLVVFVVYKFKYGRGIKLRLTQRYTRGGGVNSEGVSNPTALTYSPVNDDSDDDEADDDERLLQLVDDDK